MKLHSLLPPEVSDLVGRYGWRGLVAAAWHRFVWELDTVLVFQTAPQDHPPFPLPPTPRAEILDCDEAIRIPEVAEQAVLDRHSLHVRRSHLCSLVRVDGRPAAWSWFGTGLVYDHGTRQRRRLEQGAFYNYNTYTVPAHRGKGLHGIVVKTMVNSVRTSGGQLIQAVISPRNTASIKAYQKSLFQANHKIRLVSVLGIRFRFRIPLRPGEGSVDP